MGQSGVEGEMGRGAQQLRAGVVTLLWSGPALTQTGQNGGRSALHAFENYDQSHSKEIL